MAIKPEPPANEITLRLIVDGAEVAQATRILDPLRLSGQAVFDARYQKRLDDPVTHAHAVENAARAKAMSELLGVQDVMLERMAQMSAKTTHRPRSPSRTPAIRPRRPSAT